MKGLIFYYESGFLAPFRNIRGGSNTMTEEHTEFFGTESASIEFLKKYFPGLTRIILEKKGLHKELKSYIKRCRSYQFDIDPAKYSLYIAGYWLPKL